MLSTNHQPLQVMLEMCNQQPTTASHVGGIDSVEKPRWIGHKPKFPCNICKGDHLTHLCPGLPEARRLWSLSASSSDSESSEVSSQSIHPLVDEVVMPMQSSVIPLLFWGVMHLQTMLSHSLFNQWLRKWSCPMQSS
jgi:hypothetical protein